MAALVREWGELTRAWSRRRLPTEAAAPLDWDFRMRYFEITGRAIKRSRMAVRYLTHWDYG